MADDSTEEPMNDRELLVAIALIELNGEDVSIVDTLAALGRLDIVNEARMLAEMDGTGDEDEDEEDDDDPELEDPEPDDDDGDTPQVAEGQVLGPDLLAPTPSDEP
jgi:hypothetical protein